jgi:hypothetical protein
MRLQPAMFRERDQRVVVIVLARHTSRSGHRRGRFRQSRSDPGSTPSHRSADNGPAARRATKCGAIRTVSTTVAVWSRAPKPRRITPWIPRAISDPSDLVSHPHELRVTLPYRRSTSGWAASASPSLDPTRITSEVAAARASTTAM